MSLLNSEEWRKIGQLPLAYLFILDSIHEDVDTKILLQFTKHLLKKHNSKIANKKSVLKRIRAFFKQ